MCYGAFGKVEKELKEEDKDSFYLLYYLWHKRDHDAMLKMKFLSTKFKILSVLHKKTKICNFENVYVYGILTTV